MQPPPPRLACIPAVYLVPVRGKEVLLMRRANTGYADGFYSLIAGHLEEGETVFTAACREAFEEAGLRLTPENLVLAHVGHRRREGGEHYDRIDFYFTLTDWEGEPFNNEPEKCDDMRWCPLDALPANMVPAVRAALANMFRREIISTFGFPPQPSAIT